MNKSSAAKTHNLIELFENKKSIEETSNKLVTEIKSQGIRTIEQPSPSALITVIQKNKFLFFIVMHWYFTFNLKFHLRKK